MKLSELYTELKVSGFQEYHGAIERAKAANVGMSRSIDVAGERLIRLQTSGRILTMFLGNELPAGAARAISALTMTSSAITALTNNMRILSAVGKLGMIGAAAAVGYGVGRMGGDWLAKQINPDAAQTPDEGNERAVANAHRQNAIAQNTWNMRNALLQLQMKGLDPLSKESEYLQEELITRTHLVERAKAAATAGVVGVANAERIYEAEMKAMREAMARGRAERDIASAMERQRNAAAEEADFAQAVARARKESADQAERERNAARGIRESAFEGAIGAFGGARGEQMMEQLAAARMLRASGPEADAMMDEFRVGRLQRRLGQERGILSSILGGRPQAVRGGVSGLEDFARSIQSAAATTRQGEEEWQNRVAKALESIDQTEQELRDLVRERLTPGVQLTEGDF